MSKAKKTYVFPILNEDARTKIRNWIGTHNGMSIAKSDIYWGHEDSIVTIDVYVLNISNPKTEMLFVLSFPEAIEEKNVTIDGYGDRVWVTK